MPGEPEHGEPGRDLPPEILQQICSQLDTLVSPHIRTAIEILIDTGRRPEDVVALPLDCLASDPGGAAVLVYDNHKAHRLGQPGRPPAADCLGTVHRAPRLAHLARTAAAGRRRRIRQGPRRALLLP